MFALLESVWNLLENTWHLQNADTAQLTLGMLLQYPEKLKIQISADNQPMWNKMQAYCILIVSNFVIRPQVLIFSALKNGVFSPCWLQIEFFVSPFFWLLTFAINLRHQKLVTADVTAVFVNNQHSIQWRGQISIKSLLFEGVHSKEVDRWISWETLDKAWC